MGSLPFTVSDLQTSTNGARSSPTLLCTPLMGTTVDQMLIEMGKAKEIGADVVEIRLDCLRTFNPRPDLEILIKRSSLPTLVTYRPIWEGGQYEGDENKRQDALRLAMELGANYIDVELEVAHDFTSSINGKKPDNFKLIVSSHNFHNTPSAEAIGNLVARIQATGADIVKIATTALDITDCARIFQIMVHSQVPTIGIVMGERGLISRLLSPKFGGYLTYGALEAGAISAPGQPTAKDLLDLYNFRLIGPDTKVYGIIGKPVGHSKSPLLFNAAFKSVGLDAVYVHYLVDDVEKFFNTYSSIDWSGCSCTIPHKEAALKCMDEIDPIAKKIGAINNIVRRPDGKLIAFNTDYIGAISAIEDGLRGLNGTIPSAGSPLAGKLFVVLGAGGAGKSLAYGAAQKGARVVVANRTFERAKELADKVGGQAMTLAEVENFHPEEGMVLANTTSVGMKPKIATMLLRSLSLSHGYETLTLRLRPNRPAKNRLSSIIKSCAPRKDLQGQSVAIIGLGKSGRAAARLALARGASVLAIDENKNLGLLEQDPLFEEYSGLRTILGNLDVQLLKDVDLVVVSPGVPPENYGLSTLLESGQRIMSELDFAAEILPKDIKILAVTGTNGKSTVVTFAGQMLNHFGIDAFVGGNLGNPLSEAVFLCLSPSMKPGFQVAVVEVSSYQMEIPNKYFCPSVAAVLNLTPDHLERHKTMKNYAMTKCSLLSHMTGTKLGLLCFGNQHLNEAVREHAENFNLAWIGAFPGVKINVETKIASLEVPTMGVVSQLQLDAMKVMGTHNYYNAAVAALCVLGLDLGLDANGMSSTIENLRAPPHRMEIVHRDANGVTWVDDSKATNVEATYTGLLGLKQQKSVILLGGLAKVVYGEETNGFEQLIDPLKYHRCVITFGSSGKMIQKTLSDNGLSIPCIGAINMEDAVNCAKRMAKFGDAIVLSPGCASFDEFRNFEHRGLVFQEMAFSS